MAGLSYAAIKNYWIEAGGDPAVADIAAAITGAEAAFNPQAVQQGQPYGTTGWGLWQITPGNSVPQVGVDQALLDPLTNAKAAVAKYNAAGGFSPWVTYVNGAYKQFLGSSGGTGGGGGDIQTVDKKTGGGQTSPQSAGTLTSFQQESWWKDALTNPFKLGGELGDDLDKALGIPTLPELKNPITEAGKASAGMLHDFNDVAALAIALRHPQMWLRVGAFVVGFVAVGVAVYLLATAHGAPSVTRI